MPHPDEIRAAESALRLSGEQDFNITVNAPLSVVPQPDGQMPKVGSPPWLAAVQQRPLVVYREEPTVPVKIGVMWSPWMGWWISVNAPGFDSLTSSQFNDQLVPLRAWMVRAGLCVREGLPGKAHQLEWDDAGLLYDFFHNQNRAALAFVLKMVGAESPGGQR